MLWKTNVNHFFTLKGYCGGSDHVLWTSALPVEFLFRLQDTDPTIGGVHNLRTHPTKLSDVSKNSSSREKLVLELGRSGDTSVYNCVTTSGEERRDIFLWSKKGYLHYRIKKCKYLHHILCCQCTMLKRPVHSLAPLPYMGIHPVIFCLNPVKYGKFKMQIRVSL